MSSFDPAEARHAAPGAASIILRARHAAPLWALFALLFLSVPAFAQLEGVVDLHVHSAPDSGPRSIDAIEVARLAKRHGMRALLFKNHYTQTASLAYLVSQVVPGVEYFGGIALNGSVGGVNPRAVERMALTSGWRGKVVWMPTFDSEHYHHNLRPNPGHVPIAKDGKLLPETLEVIQLIAKHGLSLATGHSSPAESLLLIEAAKAAGVERIIVTHPMPEPVSMDIATQKKAAAMGAFLEYPFNVTLAPRAEWPGGHVPWERYIPAIREVGPEHVILSSDLGQQGNPVHTDGLIEFRKRLLDAGFSVAEIDLMMKTNPAKFLGLEP